MYRGGWAGEVVDLVHLQQQLFHHIVSEGFEVGLAQQVLDVLFAACEEVVDANDLSGTRACLDRVQMGSVGRACLALSAWAHMVAFLDQVGAQMAANEASSASDQHAVVFDTGLRLDQCLLVAISGAVRGHAAARTTEYWRLPCELLSTAGQTCATAGPQALGRASRTGGAIGLAGSAVQTASIKRQRGPQGNCHEQHERGRPRFRATSRNCGCVPGGMFKVE